MYHIYNDISPSMSLVEANNLIAAYNNDPKSYMEKKCGTVLPPTRLREIQ
jgi:hypothetical protein